MTIETKGDFDNEDIRKELNSRLIDQLNKSIEKENAKVRVRLFGIFLEIAVVGYAWYHFGWSMVVILCTLLWAINLKARYK